MRIIAPATLRGFWKRHRDAKRPLEVWLATARAADWQSLQDVRRDFPHADAATTDGGYTVTIFNVKGNHYRLITAIHYTSGCIFIRDFMTHAEYSTNAWKERH
jgi:mRNA interferase HigB